MQLNQPRESQVLSSAAAAAAPSVAGSHWAGHEYALIDFGRGRKLERIGGLVLDRTCPAAENYARSSARDWLQADLQLDTAGHLISGRPPAADWQCHWGAVTFNLRLTPFGHVGLFPEQVANWRWLVDAVRKFSATSHQPLRALNLFGYTGGSTLALASAGAHVVHVDASAPAVRWGQKNAASSGMNDHPIRWIVDDARKFVSRELRREKRYDVVVLDPPSYGHGSKGQRWDIESDLQPLLSDCLRLLAASTTGGLVLTSHSFSPTAEQIVAWITAQTALRCWHGRLALTTADARELDAGFCVRAVQGALAPA